MKAPAYIQCARPTQDGETVAEIVGDEQPVVIRQPKESVLEVWRRRLADVQGYHKQQYPDLAPQLERNAKAMVEFLESCEASEVTLFIFSKSQMNVLADEKSERVMVTPVEKK